MPSKEVARQNRVCIVPVCNAKNSDYPERIFFAVPETKKKQWLELVGGDISCIKPKKRLFCCENHFDVRKDVEGYDFYKYFGGRIKLMDNAVPSKQLGDYSEFEKVEEVLPKEEPCFEQCDESVDPLSISDDRDAVSETQTPECETDKVEIKIEPDWPPDELNVSCPGRSEEIVVKSDVYLSDDDDDNSDIGEIKTDDDSSVDSYPMVKKKSSRSAKINSKTSKHRCPICGKNMSSLRSLRRHTQSLHDDHDTTNNHENIECESKTDDEPDGKLISCTECNKTFSSRDDYLKHSINHKKTFECDVCQKVFRTRLHLKVHFPTHMAVKPYLCEVCSRPFARANNLRRHKLTHVTDKRYICDECGKRFPANYLLRQHKAKSHSEVARVLCSKCSKTFTSVAHLKVHINVHHSDVNPYRCEICKIKFSQPSALLTHRKKFHDPNSTFLCNKCPRKFPSQFELEGHTKAAHPHRAKEKTINRCDDCNITLHSPYRLKLHRLKLHNPEFQHKCATCQQTFPTEFLMSQHALRTHAPEHEYVYKCYICPKKYNQEAALKRHVKLHTDPKKPVTCELCETILGRPNRLKPHMRALHNPNNPYKCTICLQTFREQKILNSHTTQVHEQTILCEYCNKSFSKRHGLRRHIRQFHLVQAPEENE
ncbi:zinc finger protein 2-like [Bradysia coprophila]|uniref:zinc finger protein 2-like n=1 Tax=Bradysia coprophila TaxID=38358 RepID=UPI00187DB9FE|nr:zinc finger protein 2-like [Bradysia coprophila]